MKQTNNAIKFLMAQYRAIFKNAYFKGMATALVLTAGLAAGQAQAADDIIYETATTDISKATGPFPTKITSGSDLTLVAAAGNDGTGSSVSDETFTIGTGEAVQQVKQWAAGGVLVNSGATATSTNLSATNNHLNLKAGADVYRGTYGAYLYNEKGNVSATGNKLTISGVASDKTVKLLNGGGASSTDGIFGARIKSTNGSATATGNYVDITAHYGATLTLNHGGNGIVGALAEGTDTVSVTGNYVTISGTDVGTDPLHRLDLGTNGGRVHTLIGGFALNQTASGSASTPGDNTASTLTAASNYVTATNISIGGASGAYIFGGRAMNDKAADGHADLFARNNVVTLANTVVQSTSTDPNSDMQIIGNAAHVYTTNGPQDGGVNSLNAIGDGTNVNLSITDGYLKYTYEGNDASGFASLSSIAAGGVAFTNNTSSGGNVTAIRNVADIKSTEATNVNFYGGAAIDGQANSGDQAVASENVLRMDSTSLSVDSTHGYTDNFIIGGLAQLSATNLSKASATASSNTVSVTHSEYTDTDLNVEADIYGAYVDTGTTSGAAITASHNAVTVGDNIKVTGNVIGAQASHNGTFVGNTVEFDATLKADSAKTIAGVTISSGSATSGADDKNPDVITLTGNTVTLGANAETTNVDIYAAKLGTNNKDDNKTQIIHSGNTAIANGTHIYDDGDTHAISADDIQIGSTALIHVKTDTTLNISGLATGDTTPKYLNPEGADSTPSYDLDGDGTNETYDKKGAVQITSGGTLQFTDASVTISDFDYTHTGVEAGKIYVDSETNDTDPKGSYIKGVITLLLLQPIRISKVTRSMPMASTSRLTP